MSYWDSLGMLNAKDGEEFGENALLFTIENAFLMAYKNTLSEAQIRHISVLIDKCRVAPGIYLQNPANSLNGADRYMSHDQLTAIFAFSRKFDLSHHKEIWDEIKNQGLRYDNLNPSTPERWLHPRDIIYYGICAGSFAWRLLFPILGIICIISCLMKYKTRNGRKMIRTDGKLLTFVRYCGISESWSMKLIYKICTHIIEETFEDWQNIFRIYFINEDHPNVIESKGL